MSVKTNSRLVTKILRHKLNTINHNEDGYVLVSDLIKRVPKLTINILKDIVKTDNKNRFDIKEINNNLYVRANQGHSSGNLNDDKIFEKINEPIIGCYHGTYSDKVDIITKNGLSIMKRKHIHIAESDDSISGKRASCNVKIYIDTEKAMNDGIKFYRSSNNVILTRGNSKGILESKYFIKIEYI